jgi:hypothetical protein
LDKKLTSGLAIWPERNVLPPCRGSLIFNNQSTSSGDRPAENKQIDLPHGAKIQAAAGRLD